MFQIDPLLPFVPLLDASATQREEPVAVGARTHGKRHQRDFQLNGRLFPERQQYGVKVTPMARLRALAGRTAGPVRSDGLESTHCCLW